MAQSDPCHLLDNDIFDVRRLLNLASSQDRFAYAPAALTRLAAERTVVDAYLSAGEPVYGLNTGLGGNLGYRLADSEVVAYQRQIIRGRMIGMGEPLPALVVRAALLARCISLGKGGSGVSPGAAQALLALLDRGVTPLVPCHGSIGAGDLGLCAHMVAPVIGEGEALFGGQRLTGAQALEAAGLSVVALQAKDGLGLINASPLAAGYGAVVLCRAADTLLVAAAGAALADEGYAANLTIFDRRIAAARPAPGQVDAAARFRSLLQGSSLYDDRPRSIQDAISFRTMAQLFGSAWAALASVTDAVEAEINGTADSPLVLAGEGEMLSSPNFQTPGIALGFDSMAIAVTHLASASVQRIIKLQTPHLSGLPKYLSPVGGASVGFNAMQKTAAALYAAIRLQAAPASLDAVVVSDTVEDHGTQALLAIRKLEQQFELFEHLLAIEVMVAAQAVDLRGAARLGRGTQLVYDAARAVVPALAEDRPPGVDAMRIGAALAAPALAEALRGL